MAVSVLIVYGEHVKPPLARRGHLPQEIAGNQRKLSLFIAIYGGFRGLRITLAASLHFNKTQDVPIPAGQIEFAAMMRRAVVARDDHVAATAQVKISVFLRDGLCAGAQGCLLARALSPPANQARGVWLASDDRRTWRTPCSP